ncbi:hypothetical protein AWN76_003185 [Rhodothermaceae bacterium RA]|nr:hypothetical protein AWN76_003185 [Rhodothermaceae bacterium RA]
MLHIDRILVPTDYSVCADLALAHAMELAHRYEVSVDVVNVAVTAGEPPLSDAVRYWLAADPDRVSHRRVPGVGVVAALLKLVAREAYDLIVIGMHGHSGVRRFVVGSVTDELVREAPCPVLAVREKAGADAAPSIGAILVPTDFSEHAREALHVAVDLARRYEARLDVLHVVPAQALPRPTASSPSRPPWGKRRGGRRRPCAGRWKGRGRRYQSRRTPARACRGASSSRRPRRSGAT